MPGVVLDRKLVAWTASGGAPSAAREREEHAYRWSRSSARDAWMGEERSPAATPSACVPGLLELTHDLRHQLTRAELELEAREPARARAALAQARETCEEALGLRPARAVDLVALCSEEARAAARSREGREIQTSLPRSCSVACAEAALRRLLANLLGNALRATPEGEAVQFTLEHEPGAGARLTIADKCGGFDPLAIDRLLGSQASGSGSSGLGSLSVLECARRLSATIVVQSEFGAGSEFVVTIRG